MVGHQISATDRQIDRLAYELYGLMEEEIRIVEGGGDIGARETKGARWLCTTIRGHVQETVTIF